MKRYALYMRNQLQELLTCYGDIDILWLDFSYSELDPGIKVQPWMQFGGGKGKNEWEAEKLIALCRKLHPNIIINNRTEIDQDLWSPEQFQPTQWLENSLTGEKVTWEACQTFSGSWGYYRDETTWKTPKMLIDMLVNTVALGGNLIMNVGPTSRGYLDERCQNALSVYSQWFKYNGRSIYGCTMAEPEFIPPYGTRLTQSEDGKRLYIHLQTYPFKRLEMEGLHDKIEYAQFLSDGSEVIFSNRMVENSGGVNKIVIEGKTFFELPAIAPKGISPVIEVFLK